jgi:hypothetical protein
MIKPYECTQCGGTEFEDVGTKRVRCAHCGSLFEVLTNEAFLTIEKDANVIFGKNADVEIQGDVDIQAGAKVDFEGKVSMLKGNQKRQFSLKLVENGNARPDGS